MQTIKSCLAVRFRVLNLVPGRGEAAPLPGTPAGSESEEDDDRRAAHRRVLAVEGEVAGRAVDTERGDVVTSVIARIQEAARGIDVDVARVIAPGPRLPDVPEPAGVADREDGDAVVHQVWQPALGSARHQLSAAPTAFTYSA